MKCEGKDDHVRDSVLVSCHLHSVHSLPSLSSLFAYSVQCTALHIDQRRLNVPVHRY